MGIATQHRRALPASTEWTKRPPPRNGLVKDEGVHLVTSGRGNPKKAQKSVVHDSIQRPPKCCFFLCEKGWGDASTHTRATLRYGPCSFPCQPWCERACHRVAGLASVRDHKGLLPMRDRGGLLLCWRARAAMTANMASAFSSFGWVFFLFFEGQELLLPSPSFYPGHL